MVQSPDMAELSHVPAKKCLTVAGVLVEDKRVLLVKHKKLGIWLSPGGHVDEHELPHHAAEREFWEETGIRVKAVEPFHTLPSVDSEYLPSPFLTNLHWISQKNYTARVAGEKSQENNGYKTCEQHLCFIYLVKAMGSLDFRQNVEETDGIGWFTASQVQTLETTEDIKAELVYALELATQLHKD